MDQPAALPREKVVRECRLAQVCTPVLSAAPIHEYCLFVGQVRGIDFLGLATLLGAAINHGFLVNGFHVSAFQDDIAVIISLQAGRDCALANIRARQMIRHNLFDATGGNRTHDASIRS